MTFDGFLLVCCGGGGLCVLFGSHCIFQILEIRSPTKRSHQDKKRSLECDKVKTPLVCAAKGVFLLLIELTCFMWPGLPGRARGTSQKTDDTKRRSHIATGMSDVFQ